MLAKLRRYLEGGPSTLVIQALERYYDTCLGDWRREARPYLKAAKDIDSKAAGLVRFYREVVQHQAANLDLEGLLSLFEHDRTHFSKMVASLIPIMNMLTSGPLGPLLSPNPNDVDDLRPITNTGHIIEKAQVAYIGLDSLSDGLVGSAIGSILLADLAAVAGDRYNYGVSDRPVNVFVDEAAEVINDPFIQVLNKGRGAKIRLFIATQTFADFAARTGSQDKARQVLGNVNNLINNWGQSKFKFSYTVAIHWHQEKQMARLLRICPVGIPQHVIQRGNNRQACFAGEHDFAAYANWLKDASKKYSVDIHAWVLMTNHVHLLCTPKAPNAVSQMMQALGRQYVRYFNISYKRTGTLWEGRFKSCLVQEEIYLLQLYRYTPRGQVCGISKS